MLLCSEADPQTCSPLMEGNGGYGACWASLSRTSDWKVKEVMEVPHALSSGPPIPVWAGVDSLCCASHPTLAVLHRPHARMGRGMPAPTFCLVFPSNYIRARQERAVEAAQVPTGSEVLAGWTWDWQRYIGTIKICENTGGKCMLQK